MEGTPPGDAPPPPPQRATPARKGARCGAGAGSTRPHRPPPGHAGRGTLAARSGRRVAGGGTAPDTRRPSRRWKAPPPGTPFRHPHSEQRRPARAHAVGPVLGPLPASTAPGTRGSRNLAARSGGRAAEEGTVPDTRRPSQRRKAAPPGDALPPRPRRTTPARKGARRGAGTGSTRPHRPRPGRRSRNPGCALRRTSGQGRDSA